MTRIIMPRPIPVLEGQIVTLRPIEPERDAQAYYEMCLEPEMHLWTKNQVLDSIDDARAELEQLIDRDNFTVWAIEDNSSRKMIGRFAISLDNRDDGRAAGEGNRIAKPFWRKGHNREARRLVFDYVFNTLKADRIETQCWTENTNSRLSILAHGFRLVCEEQVLNRKYNKMMMASRFVLTRDEWAALNNETCLER